MVDFTNKFNNRDGIVKSARTGRRICDIPPISQNHSNCRCISNRSRRLADGPARVSCLLSVRSWQQWGQEAEFRQCLEDHKRAGLFWENGPTSVLLASGSDMIMKWVLFGATDNSDCPVKSSPKAKQNTHQKMPIPNMPHATILALLATIRFHENIQHLKRYCYYFQGGQHPTFG